MIVTHNYICLSHNTQYTIHVLNMPYTCRHSGRKLHIRHHGFFSYTWTKSNFYSHSDIFCYQLSIIIKSSIYFINILSSTPFISSSFFNKSIVLYRFNSIPLHQFTFFHQINSSIHILFHSTSSVHHSSTNH